MQDNEEVIDDSPKISISELAIVANLIDLAVQRGAYKINEIKQVGEIYEKLASFVKYVAEQQAKERSE
jgi:hypothetical protein